jgi:hypothetical protein
VIQPATRKSRSAETKQEEALARLSGGGGGNRAWSVQNDFADSEGSGTPACIGSQAQASTSAPVRPTLPVDEGYACLLVQKHLRWTICGPTS